MRNSILKLVIFFIAVSLIPIGTGYAASYANKVYGCPYHEYITYYPERMKNKCVFGDGRDLEQVTEGRLIETDNSGKDIPLLDTVKVQGKDKLRGYMVIYRDPNSSEKSFKSKPGWIREQKEIRSCCRKENSEQDLLFSVEPLTCPAGTYQKDIFGPDDDGPPVVTQEEILKQRHK